MVDRLRPETFPLDIPSIRAGRYTAVYFSREKEILEGQNYRRRVLMQVFQKNRAVLCGIDEAIAVLKLCSGYWKDLKKAQERSATYCALQCERRKAFIDGYEKTWFDAGLALLYIENELRRLWVPAFEELIVQALHDGDAISPWETVMTIEGLPQYFAHLESVYLGILARRTKVATNVAKVVKAANGKPVLFFADRFDDSQNQFGDGYAALMAGVAGVATPAMGEWLNREASGTIPHALIACYLGDTPQAAFAFAKKYPNVPCIALVDFQNNCPQTSAEVARLFEREGILNRLYGVRLDTSENLVDFSIARSKKQMGAVRPTGVSPLLVENTRRALDRAGYRQVKIVVSGGFRAERIAAFEESGVPVDAYGVGSSLLEGVNDFTADIVEVGGSHLAKVGRWKRPNPRLERVV